MWTRSLRSCATVDDAVAAYLFAGKTYPWEVLEGLSAYILQLGATLSPEEFDHPAEDVWIAKDAKVFPSAYLGGPCIIDHGAEIRHGAFIQGKCRDVAEESCGREFCWS